MIAFRLWLSAVLRDLADWLDPTDPTALLVRARVLVAAADQRFPPGYGEAKRHDVYAQLIKDFPTTPKSVLSRAIEDAL